MRREGFVRRIAHVLAAARESASMPGLDHAPCEAADLLGDCADAHRGVGSKRVVKLSGELGQIIASIDLDQPQQLCCLDRERPAPLGFAQVGDGGE